MLGPDRVAILIHGIAEDLLQLLVDVFVFANFGNNLACFFLLFGENIEFGSLVKVDLVEQDYS